MFGLRTTRLKPTKRTGFLSAFFAKNASEIKQSFKKKLIAVDEKWIVDHTSAGKAIGVQVETFYYINPVFLVLFIQTTNRFNHYKIL